MIAIIDYDAGNTKSVQNALDRLGVSSKVTKNSEDILAADRVIFPGVGQASTAMNNLKKYGLHQLIPTLKQPVFGICLGLQLLCEHSEEGDTTCLGVFETNIKKFEEKDIIPHMGWNNVKISDSKVLKGLPIDTNVYFVHSYYAELCLDTTSICDYITPFSASIEKNNFYATQFHPEKSAEVGNIILSNFLEL